MQLIRAGQLQWAGVAAVSPHGQLECPSGKQLEQLRENSLTLIHRPMFQATPAQTSENRGVKLKSCTLTTLQIRRKTRYKHDRTRL
jgi:hypothetical protein